MQKKSFYLLSIFLVTFHFLGFSQPTLSWVHGIGATSGSDVGNVYHTDSGTVYLTGRFDNTMDCDPGVGVSNITSNGGNDIFLAKYDTSGQFLWAFNLGGFDSDIANGIITDTAGNVYISGYFNSNVDFDPGPGSFTLSGGSGSGFVAKYTSDGDFIWAKHQSGGGTGADIRLDKWNNVYVVGRFSNTVNYDPGGTNFSLTTNGSSDVFFYKLSENGDFIWAKNFGGIDYDASNKMTVSKEGEVYITGFFRDGADFDPGPGTQFVNGNGWTNDIFLAKYDSNGDYVWAFGMGSGDVDNGLHVEFAKDSNLLLFTTFQNNVDFDPGPNYLPLSSNGITDIGIGKYTQNGDYIWAKSIGNYDYDWVQDAGVAPNGSIYFTGYFDDSLDMDPGPDVYNLYSDGLSDAYLCKLDQEGNFVWAKRGGGTSYDRGYYLDVTPTNDVYYSGIFLNDANFDFPGNDTITSVGSYDIFFARIANCADTFDVLATACDSFDFAGTMLLNSGNYFHTYFDSMGCDSVVALQLTINTSNLTDTLATSCTAFTWRGNTYSNSGLYDDTLTNFAGCDSIVRLNLTVSNQGVYYDTVEVCESFTWNGVNFTNSGIYNDTLQNVLGCDSIVELNLTVNSDFLSVTTSAACDSFVWRGDTYFTSGTYFDSLISSAGCDSVYQLELTMNNAWYSDTTVTACDVYNWRGIAYSISGTFYDSYTTTEGCDSIYSLNLTINNSTLATETITACDSYTWRGNMYLSSGVYYDSLTSQFGCDSIFSLNLTIKSSSLSTPTVVACDSFSWNGTTYTISGSYTDTLVNANGCDSVVILDLTILTLDTSLENSNDTLSSNDTGAFYQWINCADSSVIPGATNRIFVPSFGGSYAVIVSNSNCTDTSDCITSSLSIPESKWGNDLTIFPNPTNGDFQIEFKTELTVIKIEIRNNLGQLVDQATFENTSTVNWLLDSKPGVYYLKIEAQGRTHYVPLVKK